MEPTTLLMIMLGAVVLLMIYLMIRSKADYDFFQDQLPDGKKTNSLMRWGFVALILWTVIYSAYQMVHEKTIDIVYVTSMLGFAIGGKVIQKVQESKAPASPTEKTE